MTVFNIRKSKYSNSLIASGTANRWNKDDEFVIYCSGTVSLSVLELVAHRNSIDISSDYKLLNIALKINKSDIEVITQEELPKNWKSIKAYPVLQEIGSEWYSQQKSLILCVPSALVHWENNYLINTAHPDFKKKVSLLKTEDFIWDSRLI
ncbi:MAG: RES family NAD+ phosphorylase [Moheibacter sp.]